MNESKEDDLISVLRNLGFKVKEAKQRTDSVLGTHNEEVPLEQLIKEAMAWTRPPAETMAQKEPDIDEPRLQASQLAWKAPEAAPPDGSALPWVAVPVLLMAGLMLWIGVVKSLMVLGGLVLLVYLLGRGIPDSTT